MSDDAIKSTDRSGGLYHECKQAVHASNYGAAARTIAITLGWTVTEAEDFQNKWFGLHPGIRAWQRRIDTQLQSTRTVWNKFGFRRIYFDRVEGLLPEGLAWIPQSTVAIVSFRAGLKLEKEVPWCQLLIQVHDSFVFQFPFDKRGQLKTIKEAMRVIIPYDDPLEIPWGLKVSDKSWGDCKATEWE